MVKQNILLTVAARGGSKGVKDKNIRPLCGIPLIGHTINQAKRWGKADAIICSTDSKPIAECAKQFGAQVPFMRPDELATDTAGKVGVLRHALKTMQEIKGISYDIVVDLDVTAPIRKIDDIQTAINIFNEHRPESVVSVVPARRNPYFNMLKLNDNGTVKVVCGMDQGKLLRRQDAPIVYDMNASIYVYDAMFLLNPSTVSPLAERTLPVLMDAYSAFDIDHEHDFQFIEFLVEKGIVSL